MTRIIIGVLLSGVLCSACAAGFAEGPGADWSVTSLDDSARQAAELQAQQAQAQRQAADDALNAQQQALNQQMQQQISLMSQSLLQPPTPTFP